MRISLGVFLVMLLMLVWSAYAFGIGGVLIVAAIALILGASL